MHSLAAMAEDCTLSLAEMKEFENYEDSEDEDEVPRIIPLFSLPTSSLHAPSLPVITLSQIVNSTPHCVVLATPPALPAISPALPTTVRPALPTTL